MNFVCHILIELSTSISHSPVKELNPKSKTCECLLSNLLSKQSKTNLLKTVTSWIIVCFGEFILLTPRQAIFNFV